MRRVLVCALFLSGCEQSPAKTDPFVLRFGVVGELPALVSDGRPNTSHPVNGLVFDPLIAPSEPRGWRSRIARRVEQVEEGFVLELEEGLTFSDGTQVTPADVLASLATAGLEGRVEGGAIHLESRAGAPAATLVPNALLARRTGACALGTGPFRVVEESPGGIRLERRAPAAGLIQTVEVRVYPDGKRLFAALLSGEVNGLLMPDPGQVELLAGIPGLRHVRASGLHAVTVYFNTRRLSPDQRRAIAARLDPKEIGRAYGGDCDPLPAPESGDAEVPANLQLVTYDVDPPMGRAALALRRTLAGSAPELAVLPFEKLRDRISAGRYDLAVAPLRIRPRQSALYVWHSAYEDPMFAYENPALDAAIASGDLEGAEQILREELPYLPLCLRARTAILDARISNPTLGPWDLLETLPQWEVRP